MILSIGSPTPGHLRRAAGFFFDLAANVEANVFVMSQTRKTATRAANARIRANLCECLCECGRGPTNLANCANLAANVDAATNPYECLRMLATLQMWLRMWANVASPTNVVNFASICDKKASADACGCLAAVLSFCVPPCMKKAGNFPAFLSFPLKL